MQEVKYALTIWAFLAHSDDILVLRNLGEKPFKPRNCHSYTVEARKMTENEKEPLRGSPSLDQVSRQPLLRSLRLLRPINDFALSSKPSLT